MHYSFRLLHETFCCYWNFDSTTLPELEKNKFKLVFHSNHCQRDQLGFIAQVVCQMSMRADVKCGGASNPKSVISKQRRDGRLSTLFNVNTP